MNFKNKKIFIGIIFIIVFITSIYKYNDFRESKYIENKITEIQKYSQDFIINDDHDEKLKILKLISHDFKKYEEKKSINKEIYNEYSSKISSMKNFFINYYTVTLKNNTLDNIDTETDDNIIKDKKKNLESLVIKINNEKDIVKDYDITSSKLDEINKLIEIYNNRINNIENKNDLSSNKEYSNYTENKSIIDYENEFFIVTVPNNWKDKWSVNKRVDDVTSVTNIAKENGITSQPAIIYSFSYKGDSPNFPSGGGVEIYVFPNGLPYSGKFPELKIIGLTKNNIQVFKTIEAGAGFFSKGAKITLK